MPTIVTRGAGAELSYQQGDEQIAETPVAITGNTTLGVAHNRSQVVITSGTVTVSLPDAATLAAALNTTATAGATIGWSCKLTNNSGNKAVIDLTTGTDTLDGVADGDFFLADNSSCEICFDNVSGTKGYNIIGKPGWQLLETFTTTSGGSHSNTSIPTGTTQLKIALSGVSFQSTQQLVMQLGDSSGYSSTSSGAYRTSTFTGGTDTAAGNTSGVINLSGNYLTQSGALCGIVDAVLANTNLWVVNGNTHNVDGGASYNTIVTTATVTLSGTLDRIIFTSSGGTDTFDAGVISVYCYVP